MDCTIDLGDRTVNTPCMEKPDKSEKPLDKRPSKTSAASRLGPDAWIDAAYQLFETGGIKAVRVDPLSKALGVTRGSFYWHFEDRDALLRAILKRWSDEQTEQVIEANEARGGDAGERLLRLLKTCASDDGRLEMGMRDWAADDAEAQQDTLRIDERRIDYMTDLAVAAGIQPPVARTRCRVAYAAWLGSYVGAAASKENRLADMDALFEMMMAR